jgi:F0F1-type ATP synthase membrane subunit c/vacuolar-type H+-ATPase subunit K
MILFYCGHCAHKISVRDNYVGKQGKCSKCGSVFVVPTESTIVEFHCESCDRIISAPKSHAGKKAVCPKCKSTFIIPADQFTGPAATRNDSGDLIARTIDSHHDLTLIEVPKEYKLKDEPVDQPKASEQATERQRESEEESEAEEAESPEYHKLPWIVDIFLYPMSLSGLLHLGIFTIIPFVLSLIGMLLGPFSMAIAIPSFLINLAISLYLYWYVTECIRDSAKGGLRAPEAFATAGLEEMWSQALYIIGCCLIFLGPAFFYGIFNNKTDVVYWLLFICGIFFFPMGLLACVMFDSIRGLNPLLLIVSIFSTFFQYCGLALLITGIVIGFKTIQTMQSDSRQQGMLTTIFLERIFFLILLYIAFVVGHLLGRFFWRYQDKLNWEV